MEKDIDILIPGEINPDLILSDEALEVRFGQTESLVNHFAITIGSSSAIFACAVARLGLRTSIVGVIGEDLFGNYMRDALSRRGVDTSQIISDPTLDTGVSVILNRGSDRAILTYPGAIAALKEDQIQEDLLRRAKHLHMSSIFLQTNLKPGLGNLLMRARHHGLTTSMDTNWDPHCEWKDVSEILSFVDVFLPNQQEALAITSATDLMTALNQLCQKCKVVAIKMGKQGGLASDGNQIVKARALELKVVDTVGAGDSFNAGFLYGYLNHWNLERSLRLAAVCGSLSTRASGGTDAQPTLDEALEYLN